VSSCFSHANPEAGIKEGADLDDEALYGALGDDWGKIILRVPNITDVGQDPEIDNYGPHYPVDYKWEAYSPPTLQFKKAFFEAELGL
jgi:hypothetical protein